MGRWNSVRKATLAASIAGLVWLGVSPQAADISGSIRFAEEDFFVEVRTTGTSLLLSARGCNNFELSLPIEDRSSSISLFDANDKRLGTANATKLIEARTCGVERYSNELIFDAPTLTRWTPQADESRGTKKIAYTSALAAREIRFDPSVQLTIFDKSTRARPLRIAGVTKVAIEGEAPLLFSSDALHFSTPGGTITKEHGFGAGDSFGLASTGKAMPLPEVGRGSKIAFEAPPDQPTRVSLYYPLRGPHTLAFFKDEAQRTPTAISSLRVDGRQLLTPELSVIRVEELRLQRGPFDFLSGRERRATGLLVISFGSVGVDVRDVRIASGNPNVLSLGTRATTSGQDVLTFDAVPGGTPMEIMLSARIPNGWAPGEHTLGATVSAEGGLERQIEIPVDVIDRYANARMAVLAIIAALVLALVFRAVAKRHRAQAEDASIRARFIQQHYDEYVRTRERIESLLAADPQWSDAQAVLDDFQRKNLQSALAHQYWNAVSASAQQRKPRETLEALDRGIARLMS